MARLTTLLFAMWLGVTVSTVVDLEKRIFRGKECGPKERLYHVKVIITDPDQQQYLCGGTLISAQWILTAAHCFKRGGRYTAYIGVHPAFPKKVAIKAPVEIFSDGNEHDLMLLKLPQAVRNKPVQLPDCQHPPKKGAVVQVAGHGQTKLGPDNEKLPSTSDTLQCADMNIVDCQEYQEHEHWICYRAPTMDTGPGDSGGGVVYKERIYGVHVRGHAYAFYSPAIAMDLCYQPYLNWIKNTIKQP